MPKRIVIVGGVAAGASAAAKARRTSEDIEIVVAEAGPYISFANCGLPYYVGGEIPQRKDLFVADPETFSKRFRVDLRLQTRATAIDRQNQTVTLCGADGASDELHYDRLVLATGTVGIEPPIEGIRRPNVFTVRTVPDVDAIAEHLSRLYPTERESVAVEAAGEAPGRAIVIGAGYIGLETAEQLRRLGMKVTVVELAPQVMLALDAEMAWPLQKALEDEGVEVLLGDAVARIEDDGDQSVAVTGSGRRLAFDVGILSVGVRPNVELARSAGIELGQTGAIAVDAFQRTSDPAIYAAGDNSELPHMVLGTPVNIPLAGPANKAGRSAGANAALDLLEIGDDDPRRLRMRGVLGTAIVRVGDQSGGCTGLTESQARREGLDYRVLYMPGASHAGYYPGAKMLVLKVLYAPEDGKLLGAQAVGGEGVDKRIDVLATALQAGMTVQDLEHLDLSYAPPFGSAKDTQVQAGFAAANELRGQMPLITPADLLDRLAEGDLTVIDVRSPREYAAGHLDGAINIPVDEIRHRADEVPHNGDTALHCGVGYRSYVAQRILMNLGRSNVYNCTGGWRMLQQILAAQNANR